MRTSTAVSFSMLGEISAETAVGGFSLCGRGEQRAMVAGSAGSFVARARCGVGIEQLLHDAEHGIGAGADGPNDG